jgi:tripartite-type tricarboxylate transporter receptor subunit TctC
MKAWLLALAALAAFDASSQPTAAQPYPSKALRFVVPFPASGATDIVARILAQGLAESLAQPVIVDNRPGAGGALGSALVAKSPADGYTLLMATTSTHSIGPSLHKLSYDPLKDFAAVSLVANAANVVVVSPALEIHSIEALIAAARARPGELNYASSGIGTIVHLSAELFARMAGVRMQHVPYKGTALAAADIRDGRVAMMVDNIVTAIPLMKSGVERGLAVTSLKRSALLPELPTVAEAGLPGYESVAYFAVLAPAGTAPEIVERLNAELRRIVRSPATQARLLELGAEPVGSTPQELAATIQVEIEKWARVIRVAGVKAE